MYYLLYGLEGQLHNSSFHFLLLLFFHVNAPWQQISSYFMCFGAVQYLQNRCKCVKYINMPMLFPGIYQLKMNDAFSQEVPCFIGYMHWDRVYVRGRRILLV